MRLVMDQRVHSRNWLCRTFKVFQLKSWMTLSTEYIRLFYLITKTVRSFWTIYTRLVLSTKGLTINVVKPTSATPASKLPVVAVSTIMFYDVCRRLIKKVVDFWWSVTSLKGYLHVDLLAYFLLRGFSIWRDIYVGSSLARYWGVLMRIRHPLDLMEAELSRGLLTWVSQSSLWAWTTGEDHPWDQNSIPGWWECRVTGKDYWSFMFFFVWIRL